MQPSCTTPFRQGPTREQLLRADQLKRYPQLHPDAPIVTDGFRPRIGIEYGCGDMACTDCYEPIETTPPTITGPVATTGGRKDATYYEVAVTFPGFPTRRYQLHDEYTYGVNERAPGGWSPTNITIAALDLPPETIQALRTIWDSLFRTDGPAPVRPIRPAQPPQPAYALAEQLAALRHEAHNASQQGLTEVAALLKERACALAEQYLAVGLMCDKGHTLDQHGHCVACLGAARLLSCTRAHVDATIQRWQFEAETSDCPF